MQCSFSLGGEEQGVKRRAERRKKKALVCEDFRKAAAWTQTTLFFLSITSLINQKRLKKRKKMVDSLNNLSFVQCRLVVSLLSPLKHRGQRNYHHLSEERKSLRGHVEKKKMGLHVFLFLLLLCGKCCSSLLILPGAHPVCEILMMRIVPLFR